MAQTRSTGLDVRLVAGSGETTLKVGDFKLSGDKLYFISKIERNGNTVFINQPSAQGDVLISKRTGEYELAPKTAGEAWVVGQSLYWNDTTKAFTTTASANKLVAEASEAAAAPATTGSIILKQ